MDNARGESLARSLPFGNRRGALTALFGATLGALGIAGSEARSKKRRKKRKKECRCPSGRERLANGSCAAVCAEDIDCPANCVCQSRSHCVPPASLCADIPQICSDSSQCPFGQSCETTGCSIVDSGRCIPLCG